MTCTPVREDLIAGINRGKPPVRVLAHLRRCRACVQKLGAFRRMLALLDEWKAPEPGPFFPACYWSAIRPHRRPTNVHSVNYARH
jgi:hypothetical protein